MSVSIEQAAANLAAALVSGNTQDAESALASYEQALDGDEAPEADLGPVKRDLSLAAEEGAEEEVEEEA